MMTDPDVCININVLGAEVTPSPEAKSHINTFQLTHYNQWPLYTT